MDVKGKSVIVAGGGSGLGEATCRYLAEQGAKVFVLDKSESAATRVASDIQGVAMSCDITEAKALEAAFAQYISQPIAVAVNCAGIAPAKRMVGKSGPVSLAWFEEVVKINLTGTFNVMRLAVASMMQSDPNAQERGVIINTASIAAFDGQIGQTAYSASKGAVVAMTLPAARELAQFKIRVMTIAPGVMDTPMLQNMPSEVKAGLIAQTLFPKRVGQPDEFAKLVADIISNPMLNGEVIRLDGGVRMQPG